MAALVRPRPVAVQRKPGWSDADGWNAGEKTVPGTAVRRIPLEGLSGGHQEESQGDAGSSHLTDESAAGRAIVIVPASLDPTKPVDALLHFHGYAETEKRPFAGWREHKDDDTVRDVALDQIEQQLHATGATQLIGVLPQGGHKSQFGDMKMDSYLRQILDRLGDDGVLKAKPPSGRVIVSAHSGGGHLVKRVLDRKALPKGFGALVLFEAINNDKELATAQSWVTSRLDADLTVLADPARTARDKEAYLTTSTRFRGYYGTASSKKYGERYETLHTTIKTWFLAHAAQLGPYSAALREHYQVIASKGLGHEELIRGRKRKDKSNPGEGNVTDAVRSFYGKAPAGAAPAGPAPAGVVPAGAKAGGRASGGGQSLIGSITTITGAAVAAALTGFTDENEVTDLVFAIRHPELPGGKIPSGATALQREWIAIRRDVVRPALKATPKPAPSPAVPAPGRPVTVPGQPGPATAPGPVKAVAPGGVTPAAAASGMTAEKRAAFLKKAIEQGTVATGKGKQLAKSQAAIDAMAKDFTKAGTTATDWFANLRPDATFLGLPIKASGASAAPGVHAELAAVFASAEGTLMAKHPGKTPIQVAKELGVYAIVGLRRPKNATGGKQPSMHCYGLAVDINYAGNPFVGRPRKGGNPVVEATKRATALLSGTEYTLDAMPPGLSGGATKRSTQMWDHLHGASEALRAYLSLSDADLAARVAANGQGHDLAWWREQLAADRAISKDSEFDGHTDPAKGGFMDLSRELVEVLVGAGLTWGGTYRGGKDIMHFDLRSGTISSRK